MKHTQRKFLITRLFLPSVFKREKEREGERVEYDDMAY